jgi:NAD(P)-dependent dehydrogenase (short-subunit alcohol dehydrogenase family)
MKIDMSGKWALVTGAGSGIGRGCAEVFAQCGANVAINDIDPASAEKQAAAVRAAGRETVVIPGDVGEESAVAAMFEKLAKTTDRLHVLVNNAGFNLFKGIEQTEPADWDRIMQVDLRGIYLMTKAALPMLKSAKKSAVISIASVHAHATVPHLTAYAAAKGGVVAVTRSLCQELGPFGCRVNSISPGFVNTAIMERWLASVPDPEETMRQVNGFHPVGRIADPKEVGYLAAFLASEYAEFITGVNVTIDGGLTSRLMH